MGRLATEDDQEESKEQKRILQPIICNCMAFLATIFVVVGELMNERNGRGILIIGGGLSVLNVIITSSAIEKAQAAVLNSKMKSQNAEKPAISSRTVVVEDAVSIDLDTKHLQDAKHAYRSEHRHSEEVLPIMRSTPRNCFSGDVSEPENDAVERLRHSSEKRKESSSTERGAVFKKTERRSSRKLRDYGDTEKKRQDSRKPREERAERKERKERRERRDKRERKGRRKRKVSKAQSAKEITVIEV